MTERPLVLTLLAAVCALAACADGAGDTDDVGGESPLAGVLYINELLARNDTVYTDEAGQFDDWFELYNAGAETVDLTGFQVTDDLDGKIPYELLGGDVPASGHRVLWADEDLEQGVLHVGFKLSGDGESITLLDVDGLIVDQISFGPQTADVSYGRTADGGETWDMLPAASPGASNGGG